MKNTLLNIFLAIFVIISFTGKSWAFGSRHHHGQNGGNQGSSSSQNNTGNGSNSSWSNTPGHDSDNKGSGSTWNGSSNPNSGTGGNDPDPSLIYGSHHHKNFPAAPVPEPMTLSLMGMGLAGIFLRRKTR